MSICINVFQYGEESLLPIFGLMRSGSGNRFLHRFSDGDAFSWFRSFKLGVHLQSVYFFNHCRNGAPVLHCDHTAIYECFSVLFMVYVFPLLMLYIYDMFSFFASFAGMQCYSFALRSFDF